MFSHARILIVDSSTENREVLRTLLERQGAETLVASRAAQAGEIAERELPHLIVIDSDNHGDQSEKAVTELGRRASRSSIPIVVLGTAKRHLSPLPPGQFVSKPYHYGPLIRRIEEILESHC